MSITAEILELDKTLSYFTEGYWNAPEVTKQGYHSFNDAGVECETGEFLYGLVRILQPDKILETGTHHGIGAAYLGMGLRDNYSGHLDTLEFLQPNYDTAVTRMTTLGLNDFVTCHLIDAANFKPPSTYNLILLDTEPQTRFAELIKYWDYLEDGGFVFIHDLHRHMHQIPNEEHGFAWPFGKVPAFIKTLVNSGLIRPMHFPTPRGLTGFYKVSPKDYKWKK